MGLNRWWLAGIADDAKPSSKDSKPVNMVSDGVERAELREAGLSAREAAMVRWLEQRGDSDGANTIRAKGLAAYRSACDAGEVRDHVATVKRPKDKRSFDELWSDLMARKPEGI